MNALEKLVGLSPIDSNPGLIYVNRIPNVNAELIEAIAEEEEKSVEDPSGLKTIWQEVKDEAFDKLRTDLLSELAKKANFRQIVDRTSLPQMIVDSSRMSWSEDRMVGVVVVMPKSRYQSLFIRSLYLIHDGAYKTEFTIRIMDAAYGKAIGGDIITSTIEGSHDYPINVSIDCSKIGRKSIFIGVLVPEGVTISSMGWESDCMYSVNDFYMFDPSVMPLMTKMVELKECFVALEYEIRLSIDKVIEQYADFLRRSYAIMCGIGVIERGLKSKKASRWTMVNRDSEKLNIEDLNLDLKKELANACRLIYTEIEQEKLALVSRPDDHPGYFISSYV
jgi:hypothetical protein